MSTNGSSEHVGATTMSNRLFVCLNEAISDGGLSLDRMLAMSQVTLGAVIKRRYLAWNGRVFQVTPLGEQVRRQWDKTDIDRAGMYRPLSSYIKDSEVHRLVKSTREELKVEYTKLQHREKESEGDRVKRQKVAMKTRPAERKRGRSAA